MSGEKIELSYHMASRWKRAMAFLIDMAIAFVLALALAAGFGAIVYSSPAYLSAVTTMDEEELRSGLYEESENGTELITVLHAVEEGSSPGAYREANSLFSASLDDFFSDPHFFPGGEGMGIYDDLRFGEGALLLDGEPYFEINDGHCVPRFDEESMYSFYVEAVEGTAVPYISTLESYIDASRSVFWQLFLAIAGALLLSLLLVFVLPPSFFRRGRATLGMKCFKLAVLTPEAIPPSFSRALARNLLLVLVELFLSVFAFFLPFLVSTSMWLIRRDRSSFHDYVTATYLVDASETPVYLSFKEYLANNRASTPIDLAKGEAGGNGEESTSPRLDGVSSNT